MGETQKINHLILIAVMLLFMTNIAMASNVASPTAEEDITGGMHSYLLSLDLFQKFSDD